VAPSSEQTNTVPGASKCEPWREFIEEQLRLKRNATAIYQDLVDSHGFGHAYNAVKRFVGKLKFLEPEQFDRLEFVPGEEAQVDYGEGALTMDPSSKRYRRPRLFVMTLRYSRRSFRRVVWKSSQQTWAELHEQAFRYFGGATQYVVLDNLKEGVIKPDLYEPELNTVYGAMLKHYQCVADPARVRDPNRKGTVEHAIQHTQNTALKGRRFDTIEQQNEYLEQWEQRWASQRIHGREKRQVQAMFEEERASLTALPLQHFAYFKDLIRTVCDDTTVRVDNSNYAARPAAIGSKVVVRLSSNLVEIRALGSLTLLRTHARSERPGSVVLPDAERVFNPSRQTEHLFKLAHDIGPACQQLCRDWFTKDGRPGQRRMWGLVGLARRHPAAVVEQACEEALHEGLTSLKAITLMTAKRAEQAYRVQLDSASGAAAMPMLTQRHDLIRGAQDYADIFAMATSIDAGWQQ
jgi:transposase